MPFCEHVREEIRIYGREPHVVLLNFWFLDALLRRAFPNLDHFYLGIAALDHHHLGPAWAYVLVYPFWELPHRQAESGVGQRQNRCF